MLRAGEENQSAISTSSARPLGIGRGVRPTFTPPAAVPPALTGTVTSNQEQTRESMLEHNYEFLNDVVRKLKNEKIKPCKNVVSEEFEKLTGNTLEAVAQALGFASEQAMFDNFDLKLPREGISVSYDVLHKGPYRVQRNNKSGKPIRIPLARGEAVEAYIDSDTCWTPVNLLAKIFQCPKASFKDVCQSKIGRKGIPEDSICFNCLLSIREQCHEYLSTETHPIVENLRKLLNNSFRKRNGYELGRSSVCTQVICSWNEIVEN